MPNKKLGTSKLERKLKAAFHVGKHQATKTHVGRDTRDILIQQNNAIRLSLMFLNLTKKNRCTSKKIKKAEMDMQAMFAYIEQELRFIRNRSNNNSSSPEVRMNVESVDLILKQLSNFMSAYGPLKTKGKVK